MNLLIIFCSSPGRASRRYCPETKGKRAPIPGAPRIDTIFPPGGPEEVCSQSDPLGGTEGSNLSPSSGESGVPALQTAETARSAARSTTDLTTYGLYLRALAVFFPITKERIVEALGLLDRAISID